MRAKWDKGREIWKPPQRKRRCPGQNLCKRDVRKAKELE
jgi:hypothetical protein